MSARKERQAFREFIQNSIAARRAWAESDEGYKTLGPGMVTIPGLQDFYCILDWLDARDANDARKKRHKKKA